MRELIKSIANFLSELEEPDDGIVWLLVIILLVVGSVPALIVYLIMR